MWGQAMMFNDMRYAIAYAIDAKFRDGARAMWIRPVSHRGSGTAFDIQADRLVQVPSARGGFILSPKASEMLEPWEAVTSSAVWHEEAHEKNNPHRHVFNIDGEGE